jgi:DNA mismatch repair protein MutL
MTPRIRRLGDELANQIAAGEVVERPSSVVKELVENALDAGATRIVVDVEQGGTTLVRVADDGSGMPREDAILSLERHATSKLERIEDLLRIGTFGFRGEALPSIASVSKLTVRTRLREEAEGTEVAVSGGSRAEVRPSGGAPGTTIEVRDLFFNVPARRKFLKATATESAHVGDVVLGAALARPDVTFLLSRDGRVVREYLRAASREERARAALGGESLAPCRGARGPVSIDAMLAAPERARAGATGLSLLVNGRPVRDRFLARAVAQAYGSVLEGGRYPVGVVWLEVPPETVDVNVHPQKAEVRFADGRAVFDAITRELHAGLGRAFGLPALGAHPQAPLRRDVVTSWGSPLGGPSSSPSGSVGPAVLPAPSPLGEGNLFTRDAAASEDDPALASFTGPGLYARLRFVGQVRGTFLLCEADDGLYVLDQHAAAERVTFDRLRRAHAARGVGMQRLLVPEVTDLAPSEVALLEERGEEIAALGVEIRAVGDAAVAVHGIPDLLRRKDPTRIVRDLVAELSRSAGRPFANAVDLVLATMACHGSLRAGDAVTREEAESLLRALDEVDFAGHCPHGRPLVTRLSFAELERRVGR